jgi:hypothetical protein
MSFLKSIFKSQDRTKEVLLELKGAVETPKVEDVEAEIKELEDKKEALVVKVRELSKAIVLEKKDQIREAVKNATWTVFFIHSSLSGGHWSLSSEPLAKELDKICGTIIRYPTAIEKAKLYEEFEVWANSNYVSLSFRGRPPYVELLEEDKGPLRIEESARFLSEAIKRAGLKIDQADTQAKIVHEHTLIDGYKLLMDAGKGD